MISTSTDGQSFKKAPFFDRRGLLLHEFFISLRQSQQHPGKISIISCSNAFPVHFDEDRRKGKGIRSKMMKEQASMVVIVDDRSALLSSIKACGKTKNLKEGIRIHSEILQRRLFHKDIYINNALISMYVNCGSFRNANDLFNKISSRNVVTWNALICGYAQHGLAEEALKLFQFMRDQDNISPDSITFSCTLKACGIMKSVQKGEEIHMEVKKQGLIARNIILGTSLVDMYAKCGMIEKSQEVFEELIERNLISWNSLITGYVQHGFGEEALTCFKHMQDEGLLPDVITYTCILKACGITGLIKKGEEVHAKISKLGLLQKDVMLCTALIDMYAKCGSLEEAREVFDEIVVRSVISWNALIGGYTQHGFGHKALDCLCEMRDEGLSPDAVTFASILRACGNIGSLKKGQEIHSEINKQGLLENDIVLGTALVDMYAKCGVLTNAHRVFDELPVRNVTSWNVIISGYVQHGLGEMALKCFECMKDEHVIPDVITFICLSKACCIIGSSLKGEEIHAEAKREGLLEKNVDLTNSLVDMYAKCGAFEKAQELFDEVLVRDVSSWNVLISGYVLHELYIEAISCFDKMQDDSFEPNAFTYACILKACGILGATHKGQDIHANIKVQGLVLQKDLVLCNALIDMYAKCGACANAQDVFDELRVRDVISWTTLMSVYAQHGEIKHVFRLFNRMISQGIIPTEVTFVVMMIACSHGGLVVDGQACFDIMINIYCLIPTMEHYSCMVDLFGRAGHFDKAVIMIEKVPPCDGLELWISLLGICQKWINVEIGRWAFENSLELDEKCSAIYVSMRNIYAAAGMQDEVKKVEDLRLKNGVL